MLLQGLSSTMKEDLKLNGKTKNLHSIEDGWVELEKILIYHCLDGRMAICRGNVTTERPDKELSFIIPEEIEVNYNCSTFEKPELLSSFPEELPFSPFMVNEYFCQEINKLVSLDGTVISNILERLEEAEVYAYRGDYLFRYSEGYVLLRTSFTKVRYWDCGDRTYEITLEGYMARNWEAFQSLPPNDESFKHVEKREL